MKIAVTSVFLEVWGNKMDEKVKIEDLEFKVKEVASWQVFKPEIAFSNDGTEYLRAVGSKIVYQKTEKGYKCTACGSTVMAGTVAHPIHDGPFPLSGSGKVHPEEAPYCPKCEKAPKYSGTPITVEKD